MRVGDEGESESERVRVRVRVRVSYRRLGYMDIWIHRQDEAESGKRVWSVYGNGSG